MTGGDEMGSVKQAYIKAIANKILELHGDKFTDDFETNKRIIAEYTDIESKTLRNRVAGYITRKMRRKNV